MHLKYFYRRKTSLNFDKGLGHGELIPALVGVVVFKRWTLDGVTFQSLIGQFLEHLGVGPFMWLFVGGRIQHKILFFPWFCLKCQLKIFRLFDYDVCMCVYVHQWVWLQLLLVVILTNFAAVFLLCERFLWLVVFGWVFFFWVRVI